MQPTAPALTSLSTRASLLGRLRDYSDGVSWELFVQTYGPAIYDFCYRRGVLESSAVDIVQDVLSQVVVSIRTFEYDPARGRFRDWLGAVVRSKLARHWRAAARPGHSGPALNPDHLSGNRLEAEWASELDAHLLHAALEAIRGAFATTNWRTFELTWIHDRPATEVAATLDIPIARVYVAKSRISKRLADELRHLSDDTPWLAGPP